MKHLQSTRSKIATIRRSQHDLLKMIEKRIEVISIALENETDQEKRKRLDEDMIHTSRMRWDLRRFSEGIIASYEKEGIESVTLDDFKEIRGLMATGMYTAAEMADFYTTVPKLINEIVTSAK